MEFETFAIVLFLQCALVRESRIAVLFLVVTVFRRWFLSAQVHLVVMRFVSH